MDLSTKLIAIQQELKVPKNQWNNHSKFAFRSCEDILEELKPLLAKYSVQMVINDVLENIGERYYVKAVVTLTHGDQNLVAVAYAREDENRKGFDSAQLTGATSSYARKYALNGMFLIDDNKDYDAKNTGSDDKNASNEIIYITKEQATEIEALLVSLSVDKTKFLNYAKANTIDTILAANHKKLMEVLDERSRKLEEEKWGKS